MTAPNGRDTAAVGLLVALVLVVFRKFVFGGEVFFDRDVQLMWYTNVEVLVRCLAEGGWPVWNRFAGFGQPLWADANNQLLYPTTWLHLLMPPWVQYTVYAVLHFSWAACGLYALSRRLGLSRLGAFTAAACWILSGPMLSLTALWNQLAGAAWLPWVALAGHHAMRSGRPRHAALLGAVLAAPILAGAPEMALVAGGAVLGHGLVLAWQARRVGGLRRVVLGVALSVALALGLSAAQWIPSLEAAAHSIRSHQPPEVRLYWSAHPASLLQTVFAVPLSRLHLRPEVRAILFEGREPLILSLYLGLPSLALVVSAVVSRRRRALALLLLASAAAFALLALGKHWPVSEWLLEQPPLRAFRYPVKAMIPASLCWALLCGLGADAWLSTEPLRGWRWFAVVVVPLTGLAALSAVLAATAALDGDLLGPLVVQGPLGLFSYSELLRPAIDNLAVAAAAGFAFVGVALLRRHRRGLGPMAAVALVGVIVGDLVHANRDLSPGAPRDLYLLRPTLLQLLHREDGARLFVYDYLHPGRSQRFLRRPLPYEAARIPVGWERPAGNALAVRMYLLPPTGGPWGVEGSFEPDVVGLAPWPLWQARELLHAVEGAPAYLRLLQRAGVGHVISLHTDGFGAFPHLADVIGLLPERMRLWRVPEAMPRTYVVGSTRVAADREGLLLLAASAFDPRGEAILPDGPVLSSGTGFQGSSRVVRLGHDRVVIETQTNQPGLAVLLDRYDPGWLATVDGTPAPVLRANVMFRAVPVPAGRHTVEMAYRPRGLRLGLAASAIAALAALASLSGRARPAPDTLR